MSYIVVREHVRGPSMRHYPVFLDLRDRRVVVAGAGEVAVAKLRLLMKTEATLVVYGARSGARGAGLGGRGPARRWSSAPLGAGRRRRRGAASTARPATPRSDARAAAIGRAAGALVNIVDNLDGSDFITPAIVDRDPVTVAIGTEGAAPVLARKIKAEVEAMLPATLGRLTRIGQALPRPGRGARFAGAAGVLDALLLRARAAGAAGRRGGGARPSSSDCSPRATAPREGVVHLVGAGPGDPELLTLKARRLLHEADVVDPRPAGAAGDPRARAARGDDRRGRQDRLRAVLEAGRHQRADRRSRPRAGAPSCG